MPAFNLPPGVRESDIPGNRPEDAAWERLFDDIAGTPGGLTAAEARARWESFPKAAALLREAAQVLASEAENCRDADGPHGAARYRPRGVRLHKLASRIHAALAKMEGVRRGIC